MQDFIVCGKTGEIYAEVDIFKDESMAHFYAGEILDYRLPAELEKLLADYDAALAEAKASLVGEIEAKIYEYDLRLKDMGEKVFELYIEDKDLLTFFTKYPDGDEFLDEYPGR